MGPIWAIAVPAILTQVATPGEVGQAFVTRATSAYGEAAVAGMAIAGRLTPVAFGVIFALSGALGPIIGQNFGAGRNGPGAAQLLRDALIFTALVILLVSALLFVLRGPIADAFKAEGLTRELVYLFCGPLALLWFFNGLVFVGNAVCNNLGRPFWSTLMNSGPAHAGDDPAGPVAGAELTGRAGGAGRAGAGGCGLRAGIGLAGASGDPVACGASGARAGCPFPRARGRAGGQSGRAAGLKRRSAADRVPG